MNASHSVAGTTAHPTLLHSLLIAGQTTQNTVAAKKTTFIPTTNPTNPALDAGAAGSRLFRCSLQTEHIVPLDADMDLPLNECIDLLLPLEPLTVP